MYKSNVIKNKRLELKKHLDKFCSFTWDGLEAFDNFGAFLISDKNGLIPFSNGPDFTNQYAKPQFTSANSVLTGIDFKTQKFDLKVGVYWFTIEDYRKMLNWLHPYTISDLSFSFNPDWRYFAKLTKIANSQRHVIGRQIRPYDEFVIQLSSKDTFYHYTWKNIYHNNITRIVINDIEKTPDEWSKNQITLTTPLSKIICYERTGQAHHYTFNNADTAQADFMFSIKIQDSVHPYDDMYYTELKLTFELQGPSCLYSLHPYILDYQDQELNNGEQISIKLANTNTLAYSDLNTPLDWEMTLWPTPTFNPETNRQEFPEIFTIHAWAELDLTTTIQRIELFKCELHQWVVDDFGSMPINLRYLSEQGILLWRIGDGTEQLLTLMNSSASGTRLLQSLNVFKFMLPGILDYPDANWNDISIKLQCTNLSVHNQKSTSNNIEMNIQSYARTNII